MSEGVQGSGSLGGMGFNTEWRGEGVGGDFGVVTRSPARSMNQAHEEGKEGGGATDTASTYTDRMPCSMHSARSFSQARLARSISALRLTTSGRRGGHRRRARHTEQ